MHVNKPITGKGKEVDYELQISCKFGSNYPSGD